MSTTSSVRYLNQSPHGFSNVVDVPADGLVFVTGQMSVDAENQLVNEGDFAAQAEYVFESLARLLGEVGATFADVIKLEVLAVDDAFVGENMYAFAAARDRHIDAQNPPASAITLVSRLVHPGALIDIAVIAHRPS